MKRVWQRIVAGYQDLLQKVRVRVASPEALLQLAVLGLLTGLAAGAVILLFRLGVEGTQAALLPPGRPENYEGLGPWLRFALPLAGGLGIGLIFSWWARGEYLLGVARVMERLAYHQGHLGVREFLLQFVGAVVAIVSGHSVGREGPNIFLGAASGSLLGHSLSLPNNTIRTLVGCGTAAGISASFNTPLAGVIFALEVVLMEYSVSSFIPVILAAVSADALSVWVFGAVPAFSIPPLALGSLAEIGLVLLLGLLIGGAAAAFIQMLESVARRTQTLNFWLRTTLAGALVGAIGLLVPEVMGIGYDTVNQALVGDYGLWLLVLFAIAKMLATACSVGMGIPGGAIGPSLFIGAMVGGAVGQLAGYWLPQLGIDAGFYALLGVGAMLGASLQAPLAGLTAMMELTHSPQIVMPGMLAIVVAALISREVFGKDSIFLSVLKTSGLDYKASPVLQALRRIGVASVMDQRFVRRDHRISQDAARALLQQAPEWILLDQGGAVVALLPAVDLARHLGEQTADGEIDLLEIPARRREVVSIELQASLQEALEKLDRSGAQAVYVERMIAPAFRKTYGVLTREQIESAYRY